MILRRFLLFLKFGIYLLGGQAIQYVSRCFRKNKGVWVFGAMRGKAYGGNSRYLFEYVAEQGEGIRPVWVTKSKNVCREVRGKGYECYMFYSLGGMRAVMSAGAIFITHDVLFGDMPYCAMTNESLLVQLWHGSPIKKLGLDDPLYCSKKSVYKTLKNFLGRWFPFISYSKNPHVFISPSPEVKNIFHNAFGLKNAKLPITGNPRDDIFYEERSVDVSLRQIKKAIYLPTFRGDVGSLFDPFEEHGFKFEKYDERLRRSSIELCVKLHQYNNLPDDIIRKIDSCSNISLYSGRDVYEDICGFDCLVTDYSSIYFDYLHLNRPIMFFTLDLSSYIINDREFYYEYNDVTPGEKFYSWNELILRLCDLRNLGVDEKYRLMRDEINRRFHSHLDGNNSKRVFHYVKDLL